MASTTVSRLLKSWAMPPASRPTVSMRWAWRSASPWRSSSAVRSATRCSRVRLVSSRRPWVADSRSSSAWFSKRRRNASTIERLVVRATTDSASAVHHHHAPPWPGAGHRRTSASASPAAPARATCKPRTRAGNRPACRPRRRPCRRSRRSAAICDSAPPASKNRKPAAPHSRPAHSDPTDEISAPALGGRGIGRSAPVPAPQIDADDRHRRHRQGPRQQVQPGPTRPQRRADDDCVDHVR